MALDLSLKTGQWPSRSNSSVIRTSDSQLSHFRRDTKSYQLQQNHHHFLETENLSYQNNLHSYNAPLALVTPKKRTHHYQEGHYDELHQQHHLQQNNHHIAHLSSVTATIVPRHQELTQHHKDPVIHNVPQIHQINKCPNNIRRINSPAHTITSSVTSGNEEDGELLIVEDNNELNDSPRPASPTSPARQLNSTASNHLLKRNLSHSEEGNDSSNNGATSQLILSKKPLLNVGNGLPPKKSSIFIQRQQQEQLNQMRSNSNSPSLNNNSDHSITTIIATAATSTTNPVITPVSGVSNNKDQQLLDSNSSVSVQQCDSSSTVSSSSSSRTTISPTSTTLSKDDLSSSISNTNGNSSKDKSNAAAAKKSETKYTCTHCSKIFKKQSLLDAHLRLMNEKAKWKSFQKKKYIKTTPPPSAPPPNNNSSNSNNATQQ